MWLPAPKKAECQACLYEVRINEYQTLKGKKCFKIYLETHITLEIIGRKIKEFYDKKMTPSQKMYIFYLLAINLEAL